MNTSVLFDAIVDHIERHLRQQQPHLRGVVFHIRMNRPIAYDSSSKEGYSCYSCKKVNALVLKEIQEMQHLNDNQERSTVQSLFRCNACFEDFQHIFSSELVQSCGNNQHSYCISCMEDYVKHNIDSLLKCPICRQEFKITPELRRLSADAAKKAAQIAHAAAAQCNVHAHLFKKRKI